MTASNLRSRDRESPAPHYVEQGAEILEDGNPDRPTDGGVPGQDGAGGPFGGDPPAASARPAIKVPGYRIEKRIGQGGMAAVYLAIQESLDRPLALKVLNAVHSDDPRYAQRFVDEGRIIAALNHRNIITIHDVGVADGLLYISMEYVEGGDLKDRMGQPVPPQQALDLVRTLGEALDFAHRAGVVHRDVKPGNILFRADGTALLTDFGIAKRLEKDVTLGGTVLGTPGYLSPEQARGQKVDGRTDIYSLGVILYEMLVGKRPYDANSAIATILKQLQEPIPDLPARLARFQPLLDRMIARDADDRFADMSAMLAELDAVGTREARTGRQRGGRRLALAGVATAAAAAALGAALHLEPWRHAAPSTPREPVATTGTAGVTLPEAARGAAAGEPEASRPEPDSGVARIDRLNALGREALAQGRLTLPRGDSALAYFQETLKLDPDNGPAREGIAEIASRYARLAEQGLAARDFAAAKEHADLGLTAQPGDPGLTSLSQQAAKTLARIETLLTSADRALHEHRLTTPARDNALHFYDAVLEIQPANPRAVEGRTRIVRQYARLAEDKIARYQYADARALIRRGLEVQPGDRTLLALLGRARLEKAPTQLINDIKGLFD